MLIVYLTDDQSLIQWGTAPQVGAPFPGSDQTITSLEFYQGDAESVCLAISGTIYHEPGETLDVEIAPDRSIIRNGWSMEGKPPTGRLMDYEATGQGTLMRPVPSRWYIDQIETCKPVQPGTYKAIYLCFCVDAPLAAAA